MLWHATFRCRVFTFTFHRACNIVAKDVTLIFWMKAMPKITIYDTTLRDGSQSEEINFSVEDKIKIRAQAGQVWHSLY
jgi:2-isopropylmalate synthase (EC 2.3.3.13)